MSLSNFLLTTGAISLAFLGCSSKNDSVRKAKEQTNAQVSARPSDSDTKFLTEMADARMMDFEEGKLAAERGTRKSIRQYGELMMTDQEHLLQDLKNVARAANVILPSKISEAKADGLQELKKEKGPKFDRKFISMITIDHERDVKAFENAKNSANDFSSEVQTFAAKNLSLVETHLEKIKTFKSEK